MKWIKRLFLFFFIPYSLLCIFLYFVQDQVIFNPDKLPDNHRFRQGKEISLPVAQDIALSCLWLKEPPSKGVILYLHGNRGNNRRCLYQAEMMADNGYDIFMPDYRGYGKSDGRIYAEKQLFKDVDKAYEFLKKHYTEQQIVVVGYSLGTGMASYLAAKHSPQQLILLAPYVSLTDLKNRKLAFVPDFLLKYPLENNQHLAATSCPVTLFHGTNDNVIPFESSERLQQIDSERIKLVKLERESHRGTIFNRRFRLEVGELLNNVQ
ncbi:MAG: alpha/beta fold hydrolase [Bacteroidota bacterium]